MSSFQGIWVPLVTPFHNGAIDFVALRRLVGHLLEKGVDGLIVAQHHQYGLATLEQF